MRFDSNRTVKINIRVQFNFDFHRGLQNRILPDSFFKTSASLTNRIMDSRVRYE